MPNGYIFLPLSPDVCQSCFPTVFSVLLCDLSGCFSFIFHAFARWALFREIVNLLSRDADLSVFRIFSVLRKTKKIGWSFADELTKRKTISNMSDDMKQ